jgi:hypothetical protein
MAEDTPIQRMFLYDEKEPTVDDLVNLSSDQIGVLSEFIDRHGFYGAEPREVLDLATGLGLSYEKTLDLLRYSAFLEQERTRLALTPDELIAEFRTYLIRHKLPTLLDGLPRIADALRMLFADRPEIAFRTKVRSVTTGIVPFASDFLSLCDLRPIFNDQRDAILDYATVALVRVQVRNDLREDSTLIFQIDQKGFAQMETFMENLGKKMAVLEEVREKLVGQKK